MFKGLFLLSLLKAYPMNELQVKITADIANLQAALNKAKASLKSFEESTEKEVEKSNVGFKRKIGLIESLTNKSKALRTALSQATNEKDVERYNQELEKTVQELTRLNALGRTLGNASTGAAGGINKLATAQGNANGVALEFNRIIQDAPFGLVGIGNNLQQLTANFSQVSKSAGGAGAAIKASLSALISPANLLVLGISAVTAAFTAYQMGAFDSLFATEEAGKALEDYNKELENTIDNLSRFEKVSIATANGIEKEKIELDSLFAILKDQNLSQDVRIGAYNKLISLYPNLLKGLSQEKALTGDLANEYRLLTEAIGQKALAAALEGELIDSFKEQFNIQKQFNVEKNKELELQNKLAKVQATLSVLKFDKQGIIELRQEEKAITDELTKQSEIVSLTQRLLNAQGAEAENLKSKLLEVNKEVATLFGFEGVKETPIKTISDEVETVLEKFTDTRWQEAENNLIKITNLLRPIAEGLDVNLLSGVSVPVLETAEEVDPEENANRIKELTELLGKQKLQVDELANAFTGLGALIGSAFKNPQFGSFIGQFAQFVTKVVAGAFAVSKANAIAGATQSSLFTGPAAAFTLPAFIAGAIGLVASAFAGLKGGGGSGGGGGASAGPAATPQLFSNAQAKVPGSFNPDLAGFGSGFNTMGGTLTAEIDMDRLVFSLDMNREKKKRI